MRSIPLWVCTALAAGAVILRLKARNSKHSPAPNCIPIIDISPFAAPDKHDDAARARTAAAWDKAMRFAGFAIVSGHGVPPALVAELRAAMREFFSFDADVKAQYCHGPYGNPSGGYTGQGVESVGRTFEGKKSPPDLVENYVFRGREDQWGATASTPGLPPEGPLPAHAPVLADPGTRYFCALRAVMHTLNRVSAAALGLPPRFFDPFFTAPSLSLRLAHYPPLPPAVQPGQLRYGEHTDYQGFTILLQDERDEGVAGAGGLEVRLGGAWHPVTPVAGCFVVNIGDLYEVWTNGRWRSTVHRVSNPPPDGEAAKRDRYSVPFFTGPCDDALIEPLPTCVDAEHPPLHAPVKALDHLLAKLGISNV